MTFDIRVFRANLQAQTPREFNDDIVYRYFNTALFTRYGVTTPFDAAYSHTRGYRFNYPGAFPALYFALSDLVATLEAGSRPNPLATVFDNQEREPALLFSVKVIGRFLDLTDPQTLDALSLDAQDPEYLIPTQAWEHAAQQRQRAITHQIGQAVYDAGLDGLVYFSYPAWQLRAQYQPDMISALCVFMSATNPAAPNSPSTVLTLHDPDNVTDKLIP